MKFIAGFVAGLVLGGTAGVHAAGCFGSGYAMGWTVELNGEEVCSDPYIWTGINEIECD